MARTDPQFKLRMKAHLKEALEQKAEKNGRSMNAELVHRLEQSLEADSQALRALQGNPYESIAELTAQIETLLKGIAAANKLAAIKHGTIEVKDDHSGSKRETTERNIRDRW